MTNNIQFITINNQEMAVLPRDDFDKLIASKTDDIIDISIYDDIKIKLAIGEEEYIPDEFAQKILNGENKIKIFRELRKINQADLAEKIGVSQGYITSLENGSKNGSIDIIRKIAAQLNVLIDDIVPNNI